MSGESPDVATIRDDDPMTRATARALIADAQRWQKAYAEARDALAAAQAEADTLRTALEACQAKQPETLAWIRSHGIVFDGPLGIDPKNWQHVAFSIYTDLCEVETIARAALAGDDS